MTDETLMSLLRTTRDEPLERLGENEAAWTLNTFSILKHRPDYSDGFGHSLRAESCLYKRWFNFPDLGKRGWAIMFHSFDPADGQLTKTENFPGWVPPGRVAEADRWIEFLNGEIRKRLDEAGASKRTSPEVDR